MASRRVHVQHEELGVGLYRQSGAVPTMAEDKNVGDRRTVLQGDVAVVGRLQELPTKAPLSMEASWRAVVVGAVLPMVVADAAAGVPPSGLLAMLQGGEEAVGAFGVTWREGEDQDELGEAYPGGVLARTRARAKRALCSRSGHARHLFDEMSGRPKLLES